MEEQFKEPEYYFNKETGDLFITWWAVNRPKDDCWVQISKLAYTNLMKGFGYEY